MAVLLCAAALLGGWILWAAEARVTRYEVSETARLEVDSAAYPVQARVAGRVVSARLSLGRQIHAGDVLVELESETERLNLQEERARLAALAPQLNALNAEIGAQGKGRERDSRVLGVALDEAAAKYRESLAMAKLADADAERAVRLHSEGISSEADFQRAKAEAQGKRAAAENLRIAVSKLEPENSVRDNDRDVKLEQLHGNISRINAQAASSLATIKRLEYEIERRRIRAPIAGRLAESAVLRTGSYVVEGEKLGVILPPGGLRVVAEFAPEAAIGRLRPGQRGTLRLRGFPWAQYGTISTIVTHVASEVRDGKVRVELAVESTVGPHGPSSIPVQHGLPGSVEVEVERISPASLILRTAGGILAGQ
ncbi:MAG: HlyD family efflux transporter periplasmic adaptor subunit [Acidobacteriota bacterium]|nr:HlyD family efflux transporter periplasmic adaptor subunit [Acidobacteriota bacterium]